MAPLSDQTEESLLWQELTENLWPSVAKRLKERGAADADDIPIEALIGQVAPAGAPNWRATFSDSWRSFSHWQCGKPMKVSQHDIGPNGAAAADGPSSPELPWRGVVNSQ
jgi:hypothetical protein